MTRSGDTVKYGEHELQQIKFFNYSENNKKSVIFIHGGAWRDPNNTYDDFQEIIGNILSRDGSRANLIGVNYRLSPQFKHPSHLIDVVTALNTLNVHYSIDNIILVGHSVGATLLLQLLNYKQIIDLGVDKSDPRITNNPPASLNVSLKDLVFVDGIYDIVDLIDEYPGYALFVNEAFNSLQHYKDSSQLSSTVFQKNPLFALAGETPRFTVVQSLQDELLSARQTHGFVKFLDSLGIVPLVFFSNYGLHEQVYKLDQLANILLELINSTSQ
ncbi:hypothetical protein QCA50_009430 [Cerrena zonata]|uniref:Kynurenine formamidase n=1 Tax=Cerrena zonata TaxID=2478898 RepID=A0AAW0G8Q6_9APHY